MAHTFFVITTLLYCGSCCVFVADLSGHNRTGLARLGTLTLALSVLSHVTFALILLWPRGDLAGIYQTLNLASLLIAAAFLGTLFRFRFSVLGGFVLPVVLTFFAGTGLGLTTQGVSSEVRSALLPLHVGVNALGIVSTALAFSVALAYLLQERLLRTKRIGGIFQRLPALDRLDSLRSWLVAVGFFLLTGGLVSGVFWAFRKDPTLHPLSATQALGMASWLVFGGILLLERTAGWRGQRAAAGTLVGFALTVAVLLGYLLRAGSVG